MKTVTARDLKNKTGEVIRSIKKGEDVIVSYHGKPLAKFVPLRDSPVLTELSGILKDAKGDKNQIKEGRLKEKHEGVY